MLRGPFNKVLAKFLTSWYSTPMNTKTYIYNPDLQKSIYGVASSTMNTMMNKFERDAKMNDQSNEIMQCYIEEIVERNSCLAIHYSIENELHNFSGKNKQILDRIYESNDLDEIRLICYQCLGNAEQVEILTKWLNKKYRNAEDRWINLVA